MSTLAYSLPPERPASAAPLPGQILGAGGQPALIGALAAGMALIASPGLAALWGGLSIVTDVALQRWARTPRGREAFADPNGSRSLILLTLTRSGLWLAGPSALLLEAGTAALAAITGLIAVALAVAAGSRRLPSRLMTAQLAPAVVALLGFAAPTATGRELVGLLLVCGGFIAAWTIRSRRGHSRAENQPATPGSEADQLARALVRSEAAERRLRIAAEIANLHAYEMDFVERTITNVVPPSDFLGGPLSFDRMMEDGFYIVHPDDRAMVERVWAAYQRGERPYRVEYRLNRPDGEEAWVFGSADLLRDERGRPRTLYGALYDITPRKRAEAELRAARDHAEAASRVKSEFLATVSHEIRTPLNGVLGMVQAMARDELSPAQRGRLEVVRRSGELLLELINNLLDLAKIEAGKLELEPGAFDVEAIARRAVEACHPTVADKNVILALWIAPAAKGVYAGDGARLGQILLNLLSNAAKFTERGSVDLEIESRDGDLVFSVRDTGEGIPPDKLDQLFDKFVQADSSTTRRFGGTGLGLAIVKELTELMKGRVEVESALGQGTQFTVTVPLQRLGDVPDGAHAAEAATDAELPPLRVLVAEDNEVNKLVLRTLLEQVGVCPHIVGDGAAALAAWRDGTWDVILMDVQMPVMDGIAAVRAIREAEADEGLTRTPVIALTANVMRHQVEEYRAAGMDATVGKPIQIVDLAAAIEKVLLEGVG